MISYDRTRNILEHLQQLVDVYPFIRSAFLYCPTSQMVYGSWLTYQPVEEASNELFQNPEHLLSYSGARLSKSHTSFFIKQLAGKTIICQHLYPDYLDSLGALIIELDLASFPLSSIFNPESSSRLPCFITDTNGLPIFRENSRPPLPLFFLWQHYPLSLHRQSFMPKTAWPTFITVLLPPAGPIFYKSVPANFNFIPRCLKSSCFAS